LHRREPFKTHRCGSDPTRGTWTPGGLGGDLDIAVDPTSTADLGVRAMDSRSAVPAHDEPRAVWTGRVEFDLLDRAGWRVGVVEVAVRTDLVTVWLFPGRALAVLDRERLRRWFRRRSDTWLVHDDIELLARGDNVAIRIDGAGIHPVPLDVVTKLRAVL
jgi:hypothetical protein